MAITFHERQREAIEHVEGPMLVVAGAGTGKTAVLVERVARLIEGGHARPEEILAVTYTVEAAEELRQRVSERLGDDRASSLRAATFHAYAFDLLKSCGKGFDVLDDHDLWVYLRPRLRELGLQRLLKAAQPAQSLGDLLQFIRCCHDELVDPERYESYVERVARGELPAPRVSRSKDAATLPPGEALARCREIASAFRAAEKMLRQDRLGTFGHMIGNAVRLLREDPGVLARERAKTHFLLVDEFQDSNLAQIELAALVAGEARNVFAVGDPDQAIYHFRGASSAAFDQFLLRFPGAKTVQLEENHRSTRNILQCAFAAIQSNPPVTRPGAGLGAEFERRPLSPAREREAGGGALPQTPVEIVLAADGRAEAAEVAESILQQREELGRWDDFAVLYRQHSHRDLLVEELEERRIPFAVEGLNVLDTGPVRDLLACLRSVASASDSVSLLRLAALPRFGLDGILFRRQLTKAKTPADFRKALARFPGGKELLRRRNEAARAAENSLLKLSALIPQMAQAFELDLTPEPLAAFQKFVEQWEEKKLPGNKGLHEFLAYLEYFIEAGGPISVGKPKGDAVRLMTIHGAKGREFRRVYVVRVQSSSLPANYQEPLFEFPAELRDPRSLSEGDAKALHGQEELRLFYVAMTRARDSLTLSSTKRGSAKHPMPARFLRELSGPGPATGCWHAREAQTYRLKEVAAAAAVSPVAAWLEFPPEMGAAVGRLSASAVDTYRRCPLQFKIRRYWHLPDEPSAATQFGASVHRVLKTYFESVLAGCPLTAQQVQEEFLKDFRGVAVEEGLQRDLYEEQGIRQLRDFLQAQQAAVPAEVKATEQWFEVEIGGSTVTGRVDRLDRADDGVVIVDYKTGRPKDQDDADESLQLSIYAIAAQRQWKLEPRRLVFYNLETNQAIETTRSQKQLDEAEQQVRAAAENIAQGHFEAKPGWHCRWCSYRSLCPATEERLFTIQSGPGPTGAN